MASLYYLEEQKAIVLYLEEHGRSHLGHEILGMRLQDYSAALHRLLADGRIRRVSRRCFELVVP